MRIESPIQIAVHFLLGSASRVQLGVSGYSLGESVIVKIQHQAVSGSKESGLE